MTAFLASPFAPGVGVKALPLLIAPLHRASYCMHVHLRQGCLWHDPLHLRTMAGISLTFFSLIVRFRLLDRLISSDHPIIVIFVDAFKTSSILLKCSTTLVKS